MEIVGAFAKALVGLGVENVTVSELNAITDAATLVHTELRRTKVYATSGMGLAAWCRSDDTGLSSVYMAWVLNGRTLPAEPTTKLRVADAPHPCDAGDFGRCVRMLKAAPELRANLNAMRDTTPVWARLVDVWGPLEELYAQLDGADKLRTKTLCTHIYRVIRNCIEPTQVQP